MKSSRSLRSAPTALVAGVLMLTLTACAAPAQTSGSVTSTVPARQASSSAAADSASTAKSGTPSAATTPGPTITIGWVGDITPGSKYGMPPEHGRALFSAMRSTLQAPDIMAGNLEGTFGNGGPSKGDGSATYAFQAPPRNAESLAWAGFDVMSTANNHANDYLAAGQTATRKALAANRITPVGATGEIAIRTVKGVRVAFVGFAPYGWSNDLGDIAAAKALVRKAKQQADVVVVIFHGGAEGANKTHTPKGEETAFGEFRGELRAFSHAMIDTGASAVVGSGPHVVRGIERYKGKLIAYSLGNFAGWGNFNREGVLALSGLLTLRVNRAGQVLGGKWTSAKLRGEGVPKVDSAGESASLVRELSAADFRDTFKLGRDGSFSASGQ